jgi:hypothetical protein
VTTVFASLASVLLVVLAGLPIGYVVVRDIRLAVLLAPLVTALSAAVAVLLMLVVGGKLLWWLGPLLLVEWAVTPVLLRRPAPRAPHGSWADLLWLVVPLLPPFLLVIAPPTAWDAHSIWWLHAAYFTKDAALVREYIGLPSISFSHPDYPPLLSAAVAAAWSVFRGDKFYVAQFVSATLSFSSIAMLGYAVRVVTGRAAATVSRLAAVCVSLAAWGAAPEVVAGGLGDALWSAAFVAAALLLLLRPDPLRSRMLPVLLLSAAALTKNEGFLMAVGLAAVATVRARRDLRRAWALWLPVGLGLVWDVVSRHLGAKSDITSDLRLRDLLPGDTFIYDRLPPTLSAIWATVGTIVAISVVTAVFGAIFLRRQRRMLGLGPDLWLWSVALGYLGALSFTYLISKNPITWYLDTSISRVTLPLALVAVSSAVCWGVTAVTGGGGPGRPAASGPESGEARDGSATPAEPAAPAESATPTGSEVPGESPTPTGSARPTTSAGPRGSVVPRESAVSASGAFPLEAGGR